jgi:hypothetical protein
MNTKTAYIFSCYNSYLLSFGESMRLILTEAFKDLGFKVEHFYTGKSIESKEEDVVLLLMNASFFIREYSKYNFGKGKKILYSLEVLMLKNEANPIKKTQDRRLSTDRIIAEKMVDDVWVFNKKQYEDFGLPNVHYVPVGIANSIVVNNEKNNDKVLFIGAYQASSVRVKFFSKLEQAIKDKNSPLKIEIIQHQDFKSIQDTLNKISSHDMSLDVVAAPYNSYVRWHRIITLAATKVAMLSDTDLSEYGFMHGEHYFYFKDENDVVNIYNKVRNDKELLKRVTQNMFDKIMSEYKMKDIISKALNLAGD